MPALGFLKRFEQAIVDGVKQQTVRTPRKHPIRVGDVLHLFVGMRTRSCRKFAVATCVSVRAIRITRNTLRVDSDRIADLDGFARRDGFEDWTALVEHFDAQRGLPFSGEVIAWRNLTKPR